MGRVMLVTEKPGPIWLRVVSIHDPSFLSLTCAGPALLGGKWRGELGRSCQRAMRRIDLDIIVLR